MQSRRAGPRFCVSNCSATQGDMSAAAQRRLLRDDARRKSMKAVSLLVTPQCTMPLSVHNGAPLWSRDGSCVVPAVGAAATTCAAVLAARAVA